MKVRVKCYLAAENGLAVEVVPETEAEEGLLSAVWKHGELDLHCSSEGPPAMRYSIRAFRDKKGQGEV